MWLLSGCVREYQAGAHWGVGWLAEAAKPNPLEWLDAKRLAETEHHHHVWL